MRRVSRKTRRIARPLSAKMRKELAAIAAMRDEEIDTSDIPGLPRSAWKNAVRGRFYRPVKQAISMRLDADVIAWLKKPGRGCHTRANQILRQRMLAESRRA